MLLFAMLQLVNTFKIQLFTARHLSTDHFDVWIVQNIEVGVFCRYFTASQAKYEPATVVKWKDTEIYV